MIIISNKVLVHAFEFFPDLLHIFKRFGLIKLVHYLGIAAQVSHLDRELLATRT